MGKGIFINYRRKDSPALAGRIYDKMVQSFPKEEIFFDVDNIAPGDDFQEVIEKVLDKCHTMLVIIGDKWIDLIKNRYPENPESNEDWVELEIEIAIRKGLRIIPVLIEDTKMPETKSLPERIQKLSKRNAIVFRHVSFLADYSALLKALREEIKPVSTPSWYSKYKGLLGVVLLLTSLVGFYYLYDQFQLNKSKSKERASINAMIIESIKTHPNKYESCFIQVPAIKMLFPNPKPWYSGPQAPTPYPGAKNLSDSLKLKFEQVNSFFISQYYVNTAEWVAVMGEEPPKRLPRANELALEPISQDKIQEFINKLYQKTGVVFRVATKIEEEYANALGIAIKTKYYDYRILSFLHKEGNLNYPDLGFRLCTNQEFKKAISDYRI